MEALLNKYLNGDSNHHPSQLATLGKSFIKRARRIYDKKYLAAERNVKFLHDAQNLMHASPNAWPNEASHG